MHRGLLRAPSAEVLVQRCRQELRGCPSVSQDNLLAPTCAAVCPSVSQDSRQDDLEVIEDVRPLGALSFGERAPAPALVAESGDSIDVHHRCCCYIIVSNSGLGSPRRIPRWGCPAGPSAEPQQPKTGAAPLVLPSWQHKQNDSPPGDQT